MSSENGGASSAPAQQANNGDANKPAANVSAAEAVLRFVQASKDAEATTQTADTPAIPPKEESSTEQSPAAESAQPDSPEASSETTQEEQPAAQPEAESEAEGDDEADEVLSPESQTLDPEAKAYLKEKAKKYAQKAIDRERKKRTEIEGKLQQMQAQLVEMSTKPAQPTQEAAPIVDTPAPLPDLKTPAELDTFRKQIKTAARTIESLLDAAEETGTAEWNGQTYAKKDLKALMRDARETLEDKIPEQEKFFQKQQTVAQQRQHARQVAFKEFPFLADKTAPEQKMIAQVYQAVPMLNREINGDYLAGLLVLGEQKRQEMLAAQAKDKDKTADKLAPKPAPVIPKPKAPASQTVTSTAGNVARTAPDQGRVIPAPVGNQTAASAEAYLTQLDLKRRQATR